MCWTTSQILVFIGLIFEFGSVAITVRKLFWGYYKRIEEKARTGKQIRRSDQIEGTIILLLLSIGMILQGLGVFY
jgi:hypothetical protein